MMNYKNINTHEINKSKLRRKIGYIIEKEEDFFDSEFKYIVRAYIGKNPILIKSNLTQEQFDNMCEGLL